MAQLRLTLLGGFQARVDDDQDLVLSIKKAQALLAYLAIPAGKTHLRDKLATLLWGEMREPQARSGLRYALFTLRRALGDASPLRLEGEAVALDPALIDSDVEEFEQRLACGTPADLERAAVLYQGDLLEGLSVQEASFEEWLTAQRLRLRELALEALARLLAHQRDAGALEPAVQTALRLAALDPLQEPVHRTLMRLFVELGRRGAALRQYQLCVGALQRELRAEPEEETKALYREILRREPLRASWADGRRTSAPPAAPAEIPALTDSPPPEWPLVGREVELGHLRDALQAAWASEAQIVAVIGEAGIGKSRLAAEIAVEVGRKGGRTLVGCCHETEQVLPFGPWVDALRAARLSEEGELARSLAPVWRAELTRLLPQIGEAPSPGPGSDAGQLFEAIVQLLERMASVQPMLLVLEDLHWADEMSLRLLAFVGRRLQQSRIVVLVTAREEDLPGSAVLRHTLDELMREGRLARLLLPPLSREDTQALARMLMPCREAAHLESELWRASEGNPFMAVETLRALRGGALPEKASGLPLPERVRSLIADRIDRLGERSRRLVAVAAVIGRPFGFALLERAADVGEAEAALGVEELVRHRVLQGSDESFAFTHDRNREVVYGQLLLPRRRFLHRRVAEALESLLGGQPASHALTLGTHYREAGVWSKAVCHLTQAGTQAFLRYAQRDAVVCYEQALAGLAQLPENRETQEQGADLRFNLAYSLLSVGQFQRAKENLRETETLALALGDHRRLGQIHAAMTHLLGSEGDFGAAVQAGLRALTIATSLGDVPLQVWTGVGLGRVYYAQGDYRRGIQGTRQIIDTLQRTPVDERFVQMSVLPSVACRTWLALSLARLGDFAEALAWAGEAARIAEGVDAVRERIWAGYTLGFVHLVRGDVDRATPLFEQAASLCRQGPFPIYLPLVIASLGAAYTMSGRADEALPLLEQAEAEARAIKQVFGYPLILIQTGAAHLEAKQLAEASRYGAAALELARRHGGRGDEAWTLHLLGQIAGRKDPPEHQEALEQLTEALTLADELGMAPLAARCRLSLGALHHRAGHADDARRELSRAAHMLGRMQMRYWLTAAKTLLAAA